MSETRPDQIPVPDEWLSEPQLSRWLNYSRTTVVRLRKKGLPHVGHDRLRRYHLPTVVQWLENHT